MVAADSVAARSLLVEREQAFQVAGNGAAQGTGGKSLAVMTGIVAAGPIGIALGGIASSGVAGGLLGALMRLGIPRLTSELYVARFDRGAVMVAVDCADASTATRVKEVFGAASPIRVAIVEQSAKAWSAERTQASVNIE